MSESIEMTAKRLAARNTELEARVAQLSASPLGKAHEEVARLTQRLRSIHGWLERHAEHKGIREETVAGDLLCFLDGDCRHSYVSDGKCDLCGVPR